MAIPWDKESGGDLVTRLARRIFSYTNDNTNFRLNVEGQEDIMSIQYTGTGKR